MVIWELFVRLSSPDKDGKSRWVSCNEFVGEYLPLKLGNGGSWLRRGSTIDKKYIVEIDKSRTPGNSIDAIRLNGFRDNKSFRQSIRDDIKEHYRDQRCVMLGVAGSSINTKIEIDHKDGRKSDMRIADITTQNISDFQPLCKAANDVKREICKRCRVTNKRWNAKNIMGNPYSFYKGDEEYTEEIGCVGCYQYDPVEYRKESVRRISKEASDYIMNKLYRETQ